MQALIEEGRAPKIIVLENVCGTLTSHEGKDFVAICSTYAAAGYRFGALVVDAVHFVPHSRPRLFIVGLRDDMSLPEGLAASGPTRLSPWHPRGLLNAFDNLSPKLKEKWIWWNLPTPAKRTIVGTVYKRTRIDEVGRKAQRAEIRFDEIAGCLRTPAGGSSRQVIVVVDGDRVRSRLISPRETARLMGLSDDYELPTNYNEAYHLTGDGVVVPVVRHLAAHIFEPLLTSRRQLAKAAA